MGWADSPKQGKSSSSELKPVGGLVADEDVCEVTCGTYFTVARNLWGELFAWGAGSKGQLGTGKVSQAYVTPLPGLPPGQSHYEQVGIKGALFA